MKWPKLKPKQLWWNVLEICGLALIVWAAYRVNQTLSILVAGLLLLVITQFRSRA